jgi:hypothetical protein
VKLTPKRALKLIADYVNVPGAVKPVAPIREVLQALDPELSAWEVGAQATSPTGHGIDKSLLPPA